MSQQISRTVRHEDGTITTYSAVNQRTLQELIAADQAARARKAPTPAQRAAMSITDVRSAAATIARPAAAGPTSPAFNAITEVNQRVRALEAAGASHTLAVAQVFKSDPTLHAAYTAQTNPRLRTTQLQGHVPTSDERQAAADFGTRVRQLMSAGKSRRDATAIAMREDPDRHAKFLRAVNQGKQLD